jgi:hypothetical protein
VFELRHRHPRNHGTVIERRRDDRALEALDLSRELRQDARADFHQRAFLLVDLDAATAGTNGQPGAADASGDLRAQL